MQSGRPFGFFLIRGEYFLNLPRLGCSGIGQVGCAWVVLWRCRFAYLLNLKCRILTPIGNKSRNQYLWNLQQRQVIITAGHKRAVGMGKS